MRRLLAAGLALTMSCGGGEELPPTVKDVTVSASATTLLVGATTQLTARVTGVDGQPVPHPQVSWSSLAPAIIGVSPTGVATALQAGQGTVRATSGGRSGDLELTVTNPPVATAAFDRDSVVLTLPGGSATPVLIAKDAAGRVISNPTFFYSSDAPKVATVTQLGVITAVAAGTAVISASNEGVTAFLRVRVTSNVTATSPRITSVTPLVAGAAAVVTGSNFAGTIGGNVVLVEGVQATVTGATTTQLNITLPASGWACDNVRPVALQVNANNETGVGTASLRTAVERSLAVGQSLVLSTASDARCNALSGTGGSYLVTVYNVARAVAGGTASFTLRGAAMAATAATAATAAVQADAVATTRAPASVASPRRGAAARRALPDYARIGSPRFARWQEIVRDSRSEAVHADLMQRSIDFARATGSPTTAARRQRAAVEGAMPASGAFASQISSTIGAISPLKIPNLDAQNFCTSNTPIGARTAWVGPHAIIVEDTTSVLNGTPTLKGQLDSLYALVGQEFESVMWPILTQNFGNPLAMDPNLSKTGKLVMFFSPRVNAMAGGTVTGFVVSCDFFPVSQAPSSNFGEYFYAISPTSLASGISTGTRDAWMRQIRATIIHEVKHITSFAARLSTPGAEFEELWLEEGLARHAEEQFARSIYGTAWKANTGYQASVYCDVRPASTSAPQCAGRPILMLRHFDALYQYLQSPEPYTVLGRVGAGDATFYGTAWSVARWMMDHYATSEATFLTGLVQSTKSGVANLEARVTGHVWEEMFGEWALALFADDYPGVTFANERLQFPSWNLRDQFRGLCNDFGPCLNPLNPGTIYPVAVPFAPRPVSFGAFSTTVNALNAGSFSSWLVSGTQVAPQLLDLRGVAGGEPPGQLRVAIVRVQ